MSYLILIPTFLFLATTAFGQPGYTDYKQQNGMKIGTKWAMTKDSSGVKRQALFLAIENKNVQAAEFDLEIRFYYEGRLREESGIATQCLGSKKSMIGKMNGLYIVPAQFTDEQLKSSDFAFELDLENFQLVEACDKPAE